ncbi:unnamed protein product [Ceratitis capitata]|uniref:(Mediterranean fruit fly) hypothetical protein n=1 Tax=Ceratitis capitata TaxID=7213 RepID=A0A811U6U4_CERCA|nr:unnamed protein product [Ceratitis capitata]
MLPGEAHKTQQCLSYVGEHRHNGPFNKVLDTKDTLVYLARYSTPTRAIKGADITGSFQLSTTPLFEKSAEEHIILNSWCT